jgi:hypothetical protein
VRLRCSCGVRSGLGFEFCAECGLRGDGGVGGGRRMIIRGFDGVSASGGR